MKRILITGANSYVGTSFERWMKQWYDTYIIDTIDMIDHTWKTRDFSMYDVVFHVAGIAHVDIKNVSDETKELYYKVNRDLTIDTALKAKNDGVKQFIFMSSIIVYGDSNSIGKERVITKDTIPSPSNFYGDSKLQAERGILPLQSNDFKVIAIRPPMIYGKNSKGNYQKLVKYAKRFPVFPDVYNQRSMLYIDNLCEFVRLLINNEERGIFCPQNSEYVKTSEMVKYISEANEKKIILTKLFNPFLFIASKNINIINKVFGNLVYDQHMSEYKSNYIIKNLKDSIFTIEK